MKIIHIIEENIWKKVNKQPLYFADSLKEQGFIHCCLPEQVDFVVKNWFPEKKNLLLLEIDTEKLDSNLVFENHNNGSEAFPHVYGPINSSAIIACIPLI